MQPNKAFGDYRYKETFSTYWAAKDSGFTFHVPLNDTKKLLSQMSMCLSVMNNLEDSRIRNHFGFPEPGMIREDANFK